MIVFWEQVQNRLICAIDVLRVAAQCDPAERTFTAAEHGPDVGGHEPGEVEGVGGAGLLGEGADAVEPVLSTIAVPTGTETPQPTAKRLPASSRGPIEVAWVASSRAATARPLKSDR